MDDCSTIVSFIGLVIVIGLAVYTYHVSSNTKPNPDDFNGLIPKDRGDGAGY